MELDTRPIVRIYSCQGTTLRGGRCGKISDVYNAELRLWLCRMCAIIYKRASAKKRLGAKS